MNQTNRLEGNGSSRGRRGGALSDLSSTHPTGESMLPAGPVALATPCKQRGWLDTLLSPVDVDSPEIACTSNSSRDGAELLPVRPGPPPAVASPPLS